MSELFEPEIVESETEESESEYSEPTICQIGYNTSGIIVTPVRCSECHTEFYIKPDALELDLFCQYCGVQFQSYDDEF